MSSTVSQDRTDDTIDLAALGRPLLNRWKLVLALTVVGAVVGFAISKTLPKTFRSTASIYCLQSHGASDLMRNLPIALMTSGSGSGYLMTLLQSETLQRNVITRLDLLKKPEFTGKKRLTMERAVEKLRRDVSVKESKNGGIAIAATAVTPYLAADIANRTLDVLGTMVVRSSGRKAQFISDKLDQTTRDLDKAEHEMETFQQKNDIAAIDEQSKMMIGRMTELDGKLLLLDVELQEIDSHLANAGELNSLVDQQVRKKALESSRSYVLEQRADLHGKVEKLPTMVAQYGRIQRNIAVLSKTFELLTAQYQMARITQQGEDGDYQIVDRARPNTKKVGPRGSVGTVVGAMFAFLVAGMVAHIQPPKRHRRSRQQTRNAE